MTQEHAPPPAQAIPQQQRLVAGRYALLHEIGRGGMGIVWLAEDRMIGRRVAIKELHLPDGVPPEERGVFEERVLREARTAGRLNDPSVVIVYDVVQERGNTYIVMELIEAPTLADVIRQSGALPQDAVASIAGQLLSALESAHAAGIVHRDVKPSNVMLLPNGRVKLTDFGIAQSLDDPRLTSSGVLIGSPNYLAPERIHGADADASSDLWALGAVLFYAVEGYSPFERSSTAATMHAITTEVPYLTRCQGPLASVIMGLLINTPQARLTAQQVRGLLGQISGPHTGPQTVHLGYPHQTTRLTGPQPQRPPRGKARIWLAVAAVVLVAAGAATGGWFAHRAFATEKPEAANGGVMEWGEGGAVPEFKPNNGYCASGNLRPGVSYTSTVECDEPHDIQVFGVASPMENSTNFSVGYPGRERLSVYGQAWCGMVFASVWINDNRKADTLTYVTLIPSEQTWKDAERSNEHPVICVLHSRDGSQLRTSKVRG
ncbi:MAG TPA: serine/threonine-protein kinase [Actinophytocola sp.]|uniref:serine/threonine-protein kinase n=1 Tax=Actinophytocola sp. TaxID=1872138 RepID=UPI002DBFA4B2|nr:serine/threonine-protein kinase [Actinophytocola sp.]HEU5475052.1 serine/threonine-protein kinase [Actinophytocola sp.]